MSQKLKFKSVFYYIIVSFFFITNVFRVSGAEEEAVLRVSQAKDSLEVAYLSVREVERAEGDISELVTLLNTALDYYSEAEKALELGEYETAIQLAGKVVETSNIVLETYIGLIVVARRFKETVLLNQLFLSFGAICFIILFGFIGWRLFKGYYIKRVVE